MPTANDDSFIRSDLNLPESQFNCNLVTLRLHGAPIRSETVPSDAGHGAATFTPDIDQHGDVILPRKRRKLHDDAEQKCALEIQSMRSTRLSHVGQQLWRSSLLLIDFILGKRETFSQSVVLELGAGVGLFSLVAATLTCHVFLTDYLDDVLAMASNNLRASSGKLGFDPGNVSVRRLDWMAFVDTPLHHASLHHFIDVQLPPQPPQPQQQPEASNTLENSDEGITSSTQNVSRQVFVGETLPGNKDSAAPDTGADGAAELPTEARERSHTAQHSTRLADEFCWRDSDIDRLNQVDFLFAADVVYDEDLTEAFMRAAAYLMTALRQQQFYDSNFQKREPVLYLSLEKRYNFAVRDMAVKATAYDHFLTYLDTAGACGDSGAWSSCIYGLQTCTCSLVQCKQRSASPALLFLDG